MSKDTSGRLIAVFLVLLLGAWVTACATQPSVAPTSPAPADTPTPSMPGEKPRPALDGEALLKERCTGCHGLSRVEQARKTETDWKKTVERMVGKGAALTAEEQAAVIKYLAETYAR
ncbi:MAG: hypothetical protein QHJ81_11295 [Anaerolineae bacterium]|nr:hypothetical protein [Anaerolineae bacterium]